VAGTAAGAGRTGPSRGKLSGSARYQAQLGGATQFLDGRFALLRTAAVCRRRRPQQAHGAPSPGIARAAGQLAVMLQQALLQVPGNPGVKAAIGTLQNID
jgi:hypothetical protein